MSTSTLTRLRDQTRRDVVLRRFRTFGLGFLMLFDAVYSAMGYDGRQRASLGLTVGTSDPSSGVGMLVFLLGVVLMVALMWRERWPLVIALVGSAAALVVLGPTFALIGLMTVVRLRPRSEAWWAGGVVLAATGVSLWRDLMRTPPPTSFWATLFTQDGEPVEGYVPIVLTVVLVAAFVGIGLWLRTRAELRSTQEVVAEERQVVTTLTDEVTRRAERERLAREIHDGLGHNLSILSVHAGALQAMADAAAPEVANDTAAAQIKESAQVVRSTAAKSVAELHGLLDLLRSPDDPDIAAPTKTLRDVRSLVDESLTAGMHLIATVFVDDGEDLDPAIAQAAYRIVQELLTNARTHAATVPVRLSVTGGPADEHLVIATANHLPPPSGPPRDRAGDGPRRGTGLTGVRERVKHLGGDMSSGVDESGVFRVSIRLPWRRTDARPEGDPWKL